METIAIIQARLGSTRLPNKILLELQPGKTALECMLDRVKLAKSIDRIIVATTNSAKDEDLRNFLKNKGIQFCAGDEHDVLDRYYRAAQKFCHSEFDIIVRLTSDCPVIDPRVIDMVVDEYKRRGVDFCSNSLEPYSYPDGMDTEVFSFKVLERTWKEAVLPSHREHVTFYIWQNPKIFKIFYFQHEKDLSHYRLTLDYKEDFDFLKKIYEQFGNNKNFSLEEIIEFLDINPEIKNINSEVMRNAGWQSALEKDKKISDINCK
jgi:spore coat polysaccharide biosynthesis protein SpsF